MTRPLTFAATAVLVTAIAIPAAAQPAGHMLVRADTNNDGAITKAEATQMRLRMFTRMDRDLDGSISAAELEKARARIAAMARMADSMLVLRSQGMDTNGDGTLTQAEFMAHSPMFDMADRNSDGVIDPAEIALARERIDQRTR